MSEEKKYDETNRGTLYKNENKKDKQPDYRGKINIKGIDYRISAWINSINDEKVINFLVVEEEEFQKRIAHLKQKNEEVQPQVKINQDNNEPSPSKVKEEKIESYDPIFNDIFKDLNF